MISESKVKWKKKWTRKGSGRGRNKENSSGRQDKGGEGREGNCRRAQKREGEKGKISVKG
jgi:hypothetical protein